MRPAMAQHDALSRLTVERHHGTVVKMTGDGVHAAFDSPLDAVIASVEIQRQLATRTGTLTLPLRCGLHLGVDERRDNDFYGPAVNRAARIMCAAHGGQVLLSNAVVERVKEVLPRGLSLRDLGSVRLRDLAHPEHIYQLQHPDLRSDFPPLRSLEGTPNNLTQQLNSFVGRERELVEIRQLLTSNRLITLLGMGGIGKSRLSVQLAAELLDDFSDGVWFIELAALTDPGSVPQAIASVLGVKEEAGKPVIDSLIRYVSDLQILIVLDNCEQVIHGCADVAKRLLQAGPRVKVLASSRDYLRIAGETAYQVPTLSVPKKEDPLEALAQHEAVRLFIDRAASSLRGFGLTEENAAAVADICYCLDGIPLAIELAAARVRALSVQTIAARLSDRFRLLVTGDQTVLPRQRTLRALIDWSYDLLSEQERSLFQRLSVFAGGWTLEAAEAVCSDANLPEAEVLDLLTHLVEKSLVVLEAKGRYRMLDTVRHYAQEKLTACGDEAATREHHLDFYLSFAVEARSQFGSPAHELALARLDVEQENVLSALRLNDDIESNANRRLQLASALKGYWIGRGLLTLGLQVTVDALARVDTRRRDYARCRGLFDAGQLSCFMGRYADAQRYLEESIAIAREIGDKKTIAFALPPLGTAAIGLGDRAKARVYLKEAVTVSRQLGQRRELAVALIALAMLLRLEGQVSSAKPLYEEVLSIGHVLGDQNAIAISLLNLAIVAVAQGQISEARSMLSDALGIAIQVGLRPVGQSVLEVLSAVCVAEHAWKEAAYFYGAAEVQAERAGLRRDEADEVFLAPLIDKARDALSASSFESAATEGRALTYELALRQARAWLKDSVCTQ